MITSVLPCCVVVGVLTDFHKAALNKSSWRQQERTLISNKLVQVILSGVCVCVCVICMYVIPQKVAFWSSQFAPLEFLHHIVHRRVSDLKHYCLHWTENLYFKACTVKHWHEHTVKNTLTGKVPISEPCCSWEVAAAIFPPLAAVLLNSYFICYFDVVL